MNHTVINLPGGIRLIYGPIARNGHRRSLERESVDQLCRELCGPDAAIGHNPDGSPYVVGSPLHISVSHSRAYAVLASCPDRRIGVDIESLARADMIRNVASRVMSEAEAARYASDDCDDEALLTAWTIKEALYKVADEPGIDWRSALRLPDTKENGTALAGRFRCDIIFSGRVEDDWLTVVAVVSAE